MGNRTELFRYNETSGEWKKLTIKYMEEGALLIVEEGRKGIKGDSKEIIIKLNAQEIAYLMAELNKGYLKYIK